MTVLKLEEYENDFWKDVENRKTWDQIIPGELRDTKPVTLTAEVIAQFAKLIGDDNPLYSDEEFAKSTPFGGIIAPPSIHIVLMFACTEITDWMRSPGTINCGQSWYYNVPARRHHHHARHGLGQVHQEGTPVRHPRERLHQPAWPGRLHRPRLDHPAGLRRWK